MNTKICTVSLSLLAGACALVFPAAAHAGNVGYYTGCYDGVGMPAQITQAGHTPVAVNTLDAGSLAPLDGLVITCGNYSLNTAVNAAVFGGMDLFLEQQYAPSNVGASLPGTPSLVVHTYVTDLVCTTDANLASGSPITSGPGGTLTNASFHNTGVCSLMGYAAATSLPAGSIPLLTTTTTPSEVGAFAYTYGNGHIIYSMSQYIFGNTYYPGASTYFTNSIAWLLDQSSGPATTCASEGYKGVQLTWCKNICENHLTGQVLDNWIHRWINRYRYLPYCVGNTPPPPPPPGG